MSNRDTRISKSLSYLLRHGAIKEKLPIDESGNVLVSDILNHNRLKTNKVTLEDLQRVVAENNKQRFKLHEINGQLYICANQGHSIAVNNENLQKLLPEQVPDDIFHGTYSNKMDLIKSSGLRIMNRKHIHLTNNPGYIRKSCDVKIYIDTEKCLRDGIEFYKSENSVYLTEGIGGVLEEKYFKKIEYLK